jgi:uncharacterized Zn finger protein/superfamily II DNA or RNA helicase
VATKIYGKTWWGQKWLDAFNDIDNENRLPGGKIYANKGAVLSVNILGSVVTGRVQGSQKTPHKVEIEFEKFTPQQREILKQLMEKSPSTLSALMNKRLPSKLYDNLKDVGIKLFPTRWREIRARCSCSDYAIPCKHIAAVLYLICDRIDKDPFVVFDLHDCRLSTLIQKFDKYVVARKPILNTSTLFDNKKTKLTFDQEVLDRLDFSKIPHLKAMTFGILKSDIVFYEKKFQEKMSLFYDLIGNEKYNRELTEEEFLQKFPDVESWRTFEIFLNEQHRITEINPGIGKRKVAANIDNIFNLFCEMPNSLLHLLNPKLKFMYAVWQFAARLMERNAIIPQILQNEKMETLIRWIPAVYNGEVRRVIDELALTCPRIIKGMSNSHEQISALCALFVAAKSSSVNLSKLQGDDIMDLFFSGKALKFSGFTKKETPEVINQWLSNFYLVKKSHKLCMEISEENDDFQLDLKIIPDKQQEPLPLPEAFKKMSASTKFEVMSDISALADHFPELESVVDHGEPLAFDLANFTKIFLDVLPVLKAIGVLIALPKSLRDVFRPRLSLNLSAKKKISCPEKSFVDLESLLNFDWTVAVGEQNISVEEFKRLLKKSHGLVRFANTYVLMDESQMESMLKQMSNLPQSLSQAELLQAALSEEFESASVKLDEQLSNMFAEMKTYKPKILPPNLNAQLRPYQERGFSWLVQNMDMGFGSILADDMGLGKTLQVIAVILHMKNEGMLQNEKVLVIAPTGLLTNWSREIEKFTPDLKPLIYHGNKRELNGEFDLVLTSYGLIYRDKAEFQKHNWFLLVIDEAQNIKNPFAKQTKAVKSIDAVHRIAMSGTPVENRLLEYWSIFDFTNKGYLGTHGGFRTKFAVPIERERNKECLDRFIRVTCPFILRRCKSDRTIIADLPEKMENNKYCSLTKEQAALYQEILNSSLAQIAEKEGIERKGLVLKLINSLKQVCNHPAQYAKKSAALPDESGKSKMLEEILSEIHELGEKTLIFTQYVEMGNILVNLLEERFRLSIPFLNGGLSRENRDEIVSDFQENSQTRILIVSLKAGGTGLNLTAANHVIHYDLWWNPAVEAQATDRAYRIGQQNNVMVYRLLTTGTFEERIDEMIQNKKDLANITVASGEQWITEFNNNQLKDLFSLRTGV